jgi:uncharacterized protein YgiB involved in biofilm formation
LTRAHRSCHVFAVLRTHAVGVAALAGAALGLTIAAGCAGRKARSPGETGPTAEELEQRESAGQRDLAKAKGANTEGAYRLVMKRHPETSAYREASAAIGAMRAEQAKKALADGDREKATRLVAEAQKLGGAAVAARVKAVLDRMRREDVDKIAAAVAEAIQGGSTPETCAKGASIVAEAFGPDPKPEVVRETRAQTDPPLRACMQALVDGADALDAGAKMAGFAAARKVVEAPATHAALGTETRRLLIAALDDKAVRALAALTEPDMKGTTWETAALTIKSWGEAEAVTAKQVAAANESLRKVIGKDLQERAVAAYGQPKAEPVLAEVDRAVKLLGNTTPPEIKALKVRLGAWIECKRLTCKAAAKPTLAYVFGSSALTVPHAARGELVETLPNAAKVWVLASGGGQSLVAKEDPGEAPSWADKLAAAKGWIDAASLKPEDTSEWLPVGKALEGARVWMPTGRQDGLYLLGQVQTVSGNDVEVRRLFDGQAVTVKRDVLRIGILKPGMKILAFCADFQHPGPARFEEVAQTMTGNPIARVMCLTESGRDDKPRSEVIGALRTKPEWLPPRRP